MQWDKGILPELLPVVLGSFVVSLGLVDLLQRIGVLQGLKGMIPRRRKELKA